MTRAAIIILALVAGTCFADQIRIDHREGTTGNYAPVQLTTVPNFVLTFDTNGNPIIAAQSGGGPGGVTDGDKGDLTVSASGATWTVDAGAISLAKMASLAQSKLIGRWSASTGVPEAITVGADFLLTAGTLSLAVAPQPLDADLTYLAGFTPSANVKSLLNAADYAAMRTLLDVQQLDADLTDLADGSLTGSKVGTGISGDNITTGTVADARIDAAIARDSEVTAAVAALNKTGIVGFTSSDATAVATGKVKGFVVCPYAATIAGWSIVVDAGTATVKCWKIASGTAKPTVANVINTAGVAISSGTAAISTTVSDFTTTAVTANDIFAFDITTVSGVTEITFQLKLTKS